MSWHFLQGQEEAYWGGQITGWRTQCAVEIDAYARRILLARQRDGVMPRFPIWDDIKTFDGRPWNGRIDIISGGFPCTDISAARTNSREGKQMGLAGKSSGLWKEMARIIGEVQPEFALVENSPLLRGNGLITVLQNLASMGYDARWGVLGCRNFGADHIRKRMFIVANSNKSQCKRGGLSSGIYSEHANIIGSNWWKDKPRMERISHGMANWAHRLKAIGNGQVPAVVRLAFETLK